MNKITLLAALFLSSCGGTLLVEIEPEPVLVRPGKYDVIFEAQDGGDCKFFPVYEKDVWIIHEGDDKSLWIRVKGLKLISYDRSIFYGEEKEGISVIAIASGTEDGIDGTVILQVDFGVLFSCTDLASFSGTRKGD